MAHAMPGQQPKKRGQNMIWALAALGAALAALNLFCLWRLRLLQKAPQGTPQPFCGEFGDPLEPPCPETAELPFYGYTRPPK